MAEVTPERFEHDGLVVEVEHSLRVATLRYFARDASFAGAVRQITGVELPGTLAAVDSPQTRMILAWRRPTETLLIAPDTAPFSMLAARLAGAADGCLVDLSGGLKVLHVSGEGCAALLCRLGGTGSVAQPGESRPCRLADVPALVLSVRAAETLVVVDRSLLPHLLSWIRATFADL
jgi:sarcosine oxidase gamma subunit